MPFRILRFDNNLMSCATQLQTNSISFSLTSQSYAKLYENLIVNFIGFELTVPHINKNITLIGGFKV